MNALPRASAGGPLPRGLLLLNKKPGFTSFDSLKGAKRAFATGKVGHTGTLDKFASGLLLLLVGRGLKLASLFSSCDKEYVARFRFGAETDTLDPEGAVVAEAPVPDAAALEEALGAFRGNILQAPPAYSAIHINGQRAHELARQGKAPEMKKRPVAISRLELLSWEPPEAELRVSCSAGTYIRSLARDIAQAAGSRAFLSALTRVRVGGFRLEDSVEDDGGEGLAKALRPLDRKIFEALSLPYFFIDGEAAEAFCRGRPLEKALPGGERLLPAEAETALFPEQPGPARAAGVFRKNASPDELLGVLEWRNGKWGYGHVFAGN